MLRTGRAVYVAGSLIYNTYGCSKIFILRDNMYTYNDNNNNNNDTCI